MKTLVLISIIVAVISGLTIDHVPVLGEIPILGPAAVWLAEAGVSNAISGLGHRATEVWEAALDHELGLLHLAVIVVAVLLARKVIVWIVR